MFYFLETIVFLALILIVFGISKGWRPKLLEKCEAWIESWKERNLERKKVECEECGMRSLITSPIVTAHPWRETLLCDQCRNEIVKNIVSEERSIKNTSYGRRVPGIYIQDIVPFMRSISDVRHALSNLRIEPNILTVDSDRGLTLNQAATRFWNFLNEGHYLGNIDATLRTWFSSGEGFVLAWYKPFHDASGYSYSGLAFCRSEKDKYHISETKYRGA